MASDIIKYYRKYKRELQSAILEGEDKEYLEELLKYVNAHGFRIHSLEDIVKNTKENYILHYQAGRRLPVLKTSTIGRILSKKAEMT